MYPAVNAVHTNAYLESLAGKSVEIGLLVNAVVLDAVQAGASDIHIEPWQGSMVVRVRLLGVLNEMIHLPLELLEKISGRLKVLANLISYQTDLPQEGHIPAAPEFGGVELRVSIFPTVRGEKIVLRIFDSGKRQFDLSVLGFQADMLQRFIQLLERPSGLILLTGPTGSGKTTAIYSALNHLVKRNGPAVSISTVEDPVECHLPMVCQAQVNLARDFTYPIALRSLMRQDPQVIMVGEIRDAETAAIAVQAGLTGHLVISTIHSGSPSGVFARLINMEIEPFLLSSSIVGVVGLRLVRQNCQYCAEPYQPEGSLAHLLPADLLEQGTFRRGAGCSYCLQTGFYGRSAMIEMLLVNEVLRDAILQKLPTRKLQEIATQQGMQTLWQTALQRVAQGETTLEEIVRVISADQF